MDIAKLLEEQRKNWPKVEWHFLEMDIADTFPSKAFFHESMWASWLSKVQAGEREDEEYLNKRAKDFDAFLKSDEAKKHDIDPGEILADEAYASFKVSNNIYAALVVSIWSKSEITLKKITSLSKRQLNLSANLRFDFKSQQDFLDTNLGIALSTLADFDHMNAIRILNNTYKHAGGRYQPDPSKPWDHVHSAIASAWGIHSGSEIDYTGIPIAKLVEHAHLFFSELYYKVSTEVLSRRADS